MKKFSLFIGLCILFTGFVTLYSQAQEAAPPQNFIVFEEFVSPSDMPAFSKAQDQILEYWDKFNFEASVFTYRNDENAFYWVFPLQNFASLDVLYSNFMDFQKNMIEKEGYDADKNVRDLVTGRQSVLHWSQELSYHPSGEFGQSKEKPYVEWTFAYLKHGHDKEAAEAIKKYQEFYNGVDESYEWDVYTVMLGHDTPCWILMVRGENELALRELEKEMSEKYNKEFQKMWQNFAQHVRKFENKQGWFLPKWSKNWEME